MKQILDYLSYAVLFAIMAYTASAILTMARNTWKRPGRFKSGGFVPKSSVDPDSAALWLNFKRAHNGACCKAVKRARDQWDICWLDFSYGGTPVQKVKMNYCPECGRRLS